MDASLRPLAEMATAKATRVAAILIALSMFLIASIVPAQATDARATRSLTVRMAIAGTPQVALAARSALLGGDPEIQNFVEKELPLYQHLDQIETLQSMSRVLGPIGAEHATDLIKTGKRDEIQEFIEGGWRDYQRQDDRNFALEKSRGHPEDAVTQWAAEAVAQDDAGDEEALSKFVSGGYQEAYQHDLKRKLYELASSDMPTVAAGAQAALRTNSESIFEQYVHFGQFADAAVDQELADVIEVSNSVASESAFAVEKYEAAVKDAETAATAASAAHAAAEQAARHTASAARGSEEAERRANEAGRMAAMAGSAADEAIRASGEAHAAMIQTAQAMNRAAASMSGAAVAAAEAYRFAGAAATDASMAYEARLRAQKAEQLARGIQNAAHDRRLFVEAQRQANTASNAARSASNHASGAAAAANEAAGHAGQSSQAASQALAGAVYANSSAARAEKAAQRVDELTAKVAELVAAVDEATHATKIEAEAAAKAAFEAAAHASDSKGAADAAENNADDARRAATAARDHLNLASAISELAETSQLAAIEFEQERRISEAREAAKYESQMHRSSFHNDSNWEDIVDSLLPAEYPNLLESDGVIYSSDLTFPQFESKELNSKVVELLVNAPYPISGEAEIALSVGTNEALVDFQRNGLIVAMHQLHQLELGVLAEDPGSAGADRAAQLVEASASEIEGFRKEELPRLREQEFTTEIEKVLNQFRAQNSDGHFDETIATGEEALQAGTTSDLLEWLNSGLNRALETDAKILAYNTLEAVGPFSSLEARVALHGGSWELMEYLFHRAPYARIQDDIRAAAKTQVMGFHEQNKQFVALAEQAASEAEAVAAYARGAASDAKSAELRARELANLAADHASHAYQQQIRAREFLRQSHEHGMRAHAAASRARKDATSAMAMSAQAQSYSEMAQNHALGAASAARDAFDSANAAHGDASIAMSAAEQTHQYLVQEEVWASVDRAERKNAGEQVPSVRIWDIISEKINSDGIDLLKEFIGISDVEKCLAGQASGCLWTLANVVPLSKLAKVGGVIRQLVAKAGDIRVAYRERKAGLHSVGDCRVGMYSILHARTSDCYRGRLLNDAEKSEIREAGGAAYWVDISKVGDRKDFEVLVNWIPTTGLSRPMMMAKNGERAMTHEESLRLQSFVFDQIEGKSLLDQLEVSPRIDGIVKEKLKDSNGSRLQNGFMDESGFSTLRRALPIGVSRLKADSSEFLHLRSIGKNASHNNLMFLIASAQKSRGGMDLRSNQALLIKSGDKVRPTSAKRPDLQSWPSMEIDGHGSGTIDRDAKGVMYEFDTKASSRPWDHGGSALLANPSATVVLVEIDDSVIGREKQELLKTMVSESLSKSSEDVVHLRKWWFGA